MLYVRYKGLQLRFKFIFLIVFCTFISPQLCEDIEDFEILDEEEVSIVDSRIDINVGRTQRVERDASVEYEPLTGLNPIENTNTTCIDHFCENVPYYPINGINNAVKNIPNSAFQGLQGDLIEIANRLSPEEGTSLCETMQRTIFPKRANNTNNKEVFIVNVPGKKQGIIVRKCREDSNNNGGCGKATFPDGYVAECTQRYSQVHLLAFNDTGGADEALFDTFSIPSCCVCSLKKISG